MESSHAATIDSSQMIEPKVKQEPSIAAAADSHPTQPDEKKPIHNTSTRLTSHEYAGKIAHALGRLVRQTRNEKWKQKLYYHLHVVDGDQFEARVLSLLHEALEIQARTVAKERQRAANRVKNEGGNNNKVKNESSLLKEESQDRVKTEPSVKPESKEADEVKEESKKRRVSAADAVAAAASSTSHEQQINHVFTSIQQLHDVLLQQSTNPLDQSSEVKVKEEIDDSSMSIDSAASAFLSSLESTDSSLELNSPYVMVQAPAVHSYPTGATESNTVAASSSSPSTFIPRVLPKVRLSDFIGGSKSS